MYRCAIPNNHSKLFYEYLFLVSGIARTPCTTVNVLAVLSVSLSNKIPVSTQKYIFSEYSGEIPFILIQSGIFIPKYRRKAP